jgi:hypothetical protein
MWCGQRKRSSQQNPETDPHKPQLILDKGTKGIEWRIDGLFNRDIGEAGHPQAKIINLDLNITSYIKINSSGSWM